MQVLLNDIGNTVIDEVLLYPHCRLCEQWGIINCASYSQENYILTLPITYSNNTYTFIRLPNNPINGDGNVGGLIWNYGHKTKTNNKITLNIDNTKVCTSYVWFSLGK